MEKIELQRNNQTNDLKNLRIFTTMNNNVGITKNDIQEFIKIQNQTLNASQKTIDNQFTMIKLNNQLGLINKSQSTIIAIFNQYQQRIMKFKQIPFKILFNITTMLQQKPCKTIVQFLIRQLTSYNPKNIINHMRRQLCNKNWLLIIQQQDYQKIRAEMMKMEVKNKKINDLDVMTSKFAKILTYDVYV